MIVQRFDITTVEKLKDFKEYLYEIKDFFKHENFIFTCFNDDSEQEIKKKIVKSKNVIIRF